ncbi:peptidyl-prolyl cis-trans isomerase FKBP16-1, chloroplastic isoform X2 [Rosa chinensis]|uniref:peptidyl-prolyl cis-trans isomerase FKBP16-1, chloroplastic isoform X2 n=1 Tax=Rosa chinensis TaxID=74649 RepID=UPI001AD8C04A|nr:peptidyl-prolyl cis-trans isomerase FKBP16-1, chloroplastic isoform X2 [Rosa chinensis]
METLSVPSFLQLPCSPKNPRYVDKEPPKNAVAAKNLHERFPKRLPRRLLLQFMGFCPILSHPVLAAPMPEMKEPEVIRTLKLPSGVRIQVIRGFRFLEIVEGQGPAATKGDLVEINYVCRRTNGYFVHSTVDQFNGESTPVILPLDENQIIKGLEEVLVGMRIGGKRRALITPSVGYTNESLQPIPEEFGTRRSLLSHVNEPLIFESCMSLMGFHS